jgi:deazaflavin-dependent oxidoreductase (nitroreductase family)
MLTLWRVHRAVLKMSGDRATLSEPRGRKPGMLQLRTVGRKSGRPRAVVLNYIEDGDNMIVLASNGGMPADPAWWLNLQARPEAAVDLVGGRRLVHAREAVGDERERLLAALRGYRKYEDVDKILAMRGGHTALVVLTPAT